MAHLYGRSLGHIVGLAGGLVGGLVASIGLTAVRAVVNRGR
ncbi:hypothetical protein [uncultured Nocardioides sp.]|nr:hypothetical protein [uncultured Nocardioides sp.]